MKWSFKQTNLSPYNKSEETVLSLNVIASKHDCMQASVPIYLVMQLPIRNMFVPIVNINVQHSLNLQLKVIWLQRNSHAHLLE